MTEKSSLDLERRITELQNQHNECILELSKKEHEVATLSAHINDLQLQLQGEESIRTLARKLFHKTDDKIMTTFNRKGQKVKKVHQLSPPIRLSGDESYAQLLEAAKKYDTQEFFVYKSKVSKNSLKLNYRIIAKLYRIMRGFAFGIFGAISKLRKKDI
ncbi:hypothetical protein CVV43_03495 [Candidatus Saccharibacteria bacterium HGW-Saccharibacteria-1]|jgi:hypothetical protein|nr:MAG: hypothetical protein CVV43_03495 [Candidatus Saccharibacteria bacterium HGW-Saccharibacteria-1]